MASWMDGPRLLVRKTRHCSSWGWECRGDCSSCEGDGHRAVALRRRRRVTTASRRRSLRRPARGGCMAGGTRRLAPRAAECGGCAAVTRQARPRARASMAPAGRMARRGSRGQEPLEEERSARRSWPLQWSGWRKAEASASAARRGVPPASHAESGAPATAGQAGWTASGNTDRGRTVFQIPSTPSANFNRRIGDVRARSAAYSVKRATWHASSSSGTGAAARRRHGGWTARQECDAAAGGGRLRASSLPVELACCWASGRQPRRRIRQQERSLTPPEPASQVQSCSVVVHDAAAAYLLILMQAPS